MRSRAIGATLAAGLLLAAPAAGHPSQLRVRTLAQAHGRVAGFAQDGERIAWLEPDGPCHALVQVKSLTTGGLRELPQRHGPTCVEWRRGTYRRSVALGAAGALWTVYHAQADDRFLTVTRALTARRKGENEVGNPDFTAAGEPLAGDGGTLAYLDLGGAMHPGDHIVRRIEHSRAVRVPGTMGAFALAVAGRRLAILSDTNRTQDIFCACEFGPDWSPDDNSIAFSATPAGDRRFASLETVAVDGGVITKLTDNTLADEYVADGGPSWSPDGASIAFSRRTNLCGDLGCRSYDGLWVMAADGTHQRRLAGGPGDPVSSPSWSPDGTKLAFEPLIGIAVVDADGTHRHLVAAHLLAAGVDWSPDGSKIAFGDIGADETTLSVMNADGTDIRSLGVGGGDPDWSPDGTRIVYTAGSDDIRIVDADGSDDRGLTTGVTPSWSHDGSRIAFARAVTGTGAEAASPTRFAVFTIAPDGTDARRLTAGAMQLLAPTLQLRDVQTGHLAARVAYTGRGRGVALSARLAAILTEDGAGRHVALLDAGDGHAVARVDVPAGATSLSLSNRAAVFRTGRKIWLLDTRTRHVSPLATAVATPIGLSIEGRRVAWAENVHGRGRIRAVILR